jgi:putative transposase
MRKERRILDGAVYHVTARTNRKEMLLGTPFSRELFLQVLVDAKERHDFEIDNFVIMGNHIHLLIRPLNGSALSEIMKWILCVYTMSYNRIHGTWGHFWGGRYFSRPVTSFGEYIKIFTYIDQNPVKAQLAENSLCWEWSGIRHHRCGRREIISPLTLWMQLLWPEHETLRLGSDPHFTRKDADEI